MQTICADNYRAFPAVANSDLTWLEKYWLPQKQVIDLEQAYRFGNLIDAMITEPHRVNYFTHQVEGIRYTGDDFARAEEMKKAFYRDEFCRQMMQHCSFQRISYQPQFRIRYGTFKFALPAKAKWDLFCEKFDLGGDIKSTVCTTQKQCEEAVRYFNYDRSRAWYMDLEGRSNDVLIFISKINYKVFKIPVKRDSEIYRDGRAKYEELAFKWWYLFGDIQSSN
jgi:hypothetical protein